MSSSIAEDRLVFAKISARSFKFELQRLCESRYDQGEYKAKHG